MQLMALVMCSDADCLTWHLLLCEGVYEMEVVRRKIKADMR